MKRKKSISPTARTLQELRGRNLRAGVVERWVQKAGPFGKRFDLFGFIDLIYIDPARGIIGVQCCAGSGHAARRKKIVEECYADALAWLSAGGFVEIWSWSRHKLFKGSIAVRWQLRTEYITADLLENLRLHFAGVEK